MLLIIDNYDSFTYNLVEYFEKLGVQCHVHRNDTDLSIISKINYSGIVLSPGPETPHKSGNLMKILAHYETRLPILGICLGHQAIGIHFGANLIHATRPMHAKVSKIKLIHDHISENIPQFINVVRYHSLVLERLPEQFICLAKTEQDELMIMKHCVLPIYGIQFHPESILTEYGLELLNNWLILNRIIEK